MQPSFVYNYFRRLGIDRTIGDLENETQCTEPNGFYLELGGYGV